MRTAKFHGEKSGLNVSDQKYIAIGDIHGCLHSLKALTKKLKPYTDRKLVFIGDYIDRGPDSKGVVDFLMEYKKQQECIFLRGNHEQMLLDAYHKNDMELWFINGGKSTIDSYQEEVTSFTLPADHLEFYEQTELYYDTPEYFFVHAGVPPRQTIREALEDKRSEHDFLWGRSHLNTMKKPWEKTVVFGHTPRSHPIQKDKMLGIDTGCVYSSMGYGKLTAALLPENKFIQQNCLDN